MLVNVIYFHPLLNGDFEGGCSDNLRGFGLK